MNLYAIATEKNLNVETLSVNRDTKNNQLIVVTSVSQNVGSIEVPLTRKMVSYYVVADVPVSKMNEVLEASQAEAIKNFLGIGVDVVPVEAPEEAPRHLKIAEPEPEIEMKTVEPEPKKKTPSRKKAEAKKEKVKEPKKEEEADLDLDFGEEAAPDVLFDKGNKEHMAGLRDILIAELGEDWKEYPEKKNAVIKLLTEINGKVLAFNAGGTILKSFGEVVKAKLEN